MHVTPPTAQPPPLEPEERDPLGKAHAHRETVHTPQEHRLLRFLTIALVAVILGIPIIAAISGSPMINVLVGLSPLLATVLLDITAVRRHYKHLALWIILAVTHLFGIALISSLNPLLPLPLNVGGALAVSLQLSLLVTIIAWFLEARQHKAPRREHIVEFTPDKLPEYVQSIEDKVKGLNFAIGRVYRASNGGHSEMRTRLRIPSDWYNEFYAIKAEDMAEQRDKARVLVRKIHDRLSLLAKRENEVFSDAELDRLKNLARNKNGEDAVIDVLKTNDRDPVQHYYVSAVDLCERILKELER